MKNEKLKFKIKKEEVKHIAELARLELSSAEIKKMQKEMQGILGYVEQLQKADVSKAGKVFQAVDLKNVMRSDKAQSEDGDVVRQMLEQTSERQGDYVKVKQVLQ